MSLDHKEQAPKTVHISLKIGDETKTVSMSAQQAAEIGFHSPFDDTPLPLASILASLFGDSSVKTLVDRSPVACPECGLTYNEFTRVGRLSCGRCYEAFRSKLEPIMVQLHGAFTHVGQTPDEPADEHLQVHEAERLRELLQEAIDTEQYEKAAALRDRLEQLETENA
jgi:protein arginine kinase activator